MTSRHPVIAHLAGLIARWQQRLSGRVHAAGDAAARRHGWTITETRGRLGFGSRVYRDPRFNTRSAGDPAGRAGPARQHPSRAR